MQAVYKLFPIENRPNFWFLGGRRSKIEEIPVFVDLSFLWWWTSTYQNPKGWLSQKCELQSFCLSKGAHMATTSGQSAWRILRSTFFLKLRFLKVRPLVTCLKCLLNVTFSLMNLSSTLIVSPEHTKCLEKPLKSDK